jgi:hypothetical protein
MARLTFSISQLRLGGAGELELSKGLINSNVNNLAFTKFRQVDVDYGGKSCSILIVGYIKYDGSIAQLYFEGEQLRPSMQAKDGRVRQWPPHVTFSCEVANDDGHRLEKFVAGLIS